MKWHAIRLRASDAKRTNTLDNVVLRRSRRRWMNPDEIPRADSRVIRDGEKIVAS